MGYELLYCPKCDRNLNCQLYFDHLEECNLNSNNKHFKILKKIQETKEILEQHNNLLKKNQAERNKNDLKPELVIGKYSN